MTRLSGFPCTSHLRYKSAKKLIFQDSNGIRSHISFLSFVPRETSCIGLENALNRLRTEIVGPAGKKVEAQKEVLSGSLQVGDLVRMRSGLIQRIAEALLELNRVNGELDKALLLTKGKNKTRRKPRPNLQRCWQPWMTLTDKNWSISF